MSLRKKEKLCIYKIFPIKNQFETKFLKLFSPKLPFFMQTCIEF